MHLHRLMAIAGVIIGVIGLFFKSLTTDGESVLAALSQQVESFPSGLPTIWGGLDSWAQIVLVILIVVVLVLAFMPERELTYDRSGALITAVIGVALLAYAIIKTLDASDKAETLAGAFGQAAAGGVPGVEAWGVSVGVGFFVLMLGTILVAAAGVLSLIARSD